MTDFIRVASLSELPENTPVGADANGTPVVLVRRGETVFALSDTCTHAEATLSDGGHIDGDCLVCPLHYGSFDLATGAPNDPPVDMDLPTFAVRIDGDDVLVGA